MNYTAPILPVPAMREWHVCIKAGAQVLNEFDVYGVDRVSVQRSHEGLAPPGAQCCVYTPQEIALRAASADAWSRTAVDASAAQERELATMPMGGYCNG